MSKRQQKKILQYSVLFKILGVFDEADYKRITDIHKMKEK
jgi:hypothetical protein